MSQIENLQNEIETLTSLVESSASEADKIENALRANAPSLTAQSQMLTTVNQVSTQILDNLASEDENVKTLLTSFANELVRNLNGIREESTANFYRAQGRVLMLRESIENMTKKIDDAQSKLGAVQRVEKLQEDGEEVHDDPSVRPVGGHPEKISDVRMAKEYAAEEEDDVSKENPVEAESVKE